MKPLVVCHMLTSIDGRIKTENWKDIRGMEYYEQTGESESADAWMCGRVTMQQHYATPRPNLSKEARSDLSDHIAKNDASSYVITVDPYGKLGWNSPSIDQDHLIIVLSRRVDPAYPQYLREKGISYLFGGDEVIDFTDVLEKLNQHFSIRKIKLEGGGNINGALHTAGLIDEYSILIYPVADGTQSPTLLETKITDSSQIPFQQLDLQKAEVLEHGIVWLKYEVKKDDGHQI
jgi:2,5-diamino-6-(ribosylamino)-4(3H)-pyrimidinone 5'-phosphate reductase